MSREEAIARLYECSTCRRWITTPTCDGCYADRNPPLEQAIEALNRAIRLGLEAEKLRGQLRGLLK